MSKIGKKEWVIFDDIPMYLRNYQFETKLKKVKFVVLTWASNKFKNLDKGLKELGLK